MTRVTRPTSPTRSRLAGGQRSSYQAPALARYTWRTLECGIRLNGSWPETFFRVIDSASFTPELMCDMLESVWQQADYLMQFHGGGNWLVTEKSGQLTAGIVFPEFKDAPRWTATAWEVLSRELREQVLPDGAQIELTPTTTAPRSPASGLLRRGEKTASRSPRATATTCVACSEYLMHVVKPNAPSPCSMIRTGAMSAAGWPTAPTLRRQDMLFVATGGKQGTAPAGTSHVFPWAGQYVMRSGWSQNDLYLALDAGPYGYGHQHEDKLRFSICGPRPGSVVDPAASPMLPASGGSTSSAPPATHRTR